MKLFKLILVLVLCLAFGSELVAQHPHRRHRRAKRVVVVKRSPYRPAKVVVFHPHWRPAYAYHRRWVYFPRYNFYWDNWRNHYVFISSGTWVSQAAVPPFLVNVKLSEQASVELPEPEDDNDAVYEANDTHKTTVQKE